MSERPDLLAVARVHARELSSVEGVVGVVLGGSHARGAADALSDLDLGVYYREPLDVEALRTLATRMTGRPTEVAEPGGWGPWVNGGAWLDTEVGPVDWILRDLTRVEHEWDRARRGEFSLHHQAGHPFGFLSTAYVGEVATGTILADPRGEIGRVKDAAASYPEPLREAFLRWLWEAGFSLAVGRKAAARGDSAYIAMCVVHAVGIMAHALHARAGRWVTNEKGLVASAARLPGAPPDFAARAGHCVPARPRAWGCPNGWRRPRPCSPTYGPPKPGACCQPSEWCGHRGFRCRPGSGRCRSHPGTGRDGLLVFQAARTPSGLETSLLPGGRHGTSSTRCAHPRRR